QSFYTMSRRRPSFVEGMSSVLFMVTLAYRMPESALLAVLVGILTKLCDRCYSRSVTGVARLDRIDRQTFQAPQRGQHSLSPQGPRRRSRSRCLRSHRPRATDAIPRSRLFTL